MKGAREFTLDLAHSAREEARPEGILTLLAAGAAASAARYSKATAFDDFRVADSLSRSAPMGRRATDVGAVIGYPGYLMATAGAAYLAAWHYDSGPVQEYALLSFEALSLAGIQTLALKITVPRLRPDSTDLTAFPSGHTSASFSVAAVAASSGGWKAGVPAFLLASFVGYTRMESKKHYLSDVLFGAGLGIASGRAVYKVRRRGHPDRYTFAPYATPGGMGVQVFF